MELLFGEALIKSFYSRTFIPFANNFDDNFKRWFVHNYISLVCRDSYGQKIILYDDPLNQIDLPNCPLLYRERVLRDHFSPYEIIDYIKQQIDNGFYVNLAIDQFHNPLTGRYKKTHFNHHALVYGYDDERFIIADYFNTYRSVDISFDLFAMSYQDFEYDKELNGDPFITSAKYIPSRSDIYYYRPYLIQHLLCDYIKGRKEDNVWFGIHSYDVIKNSLINLKFQDRIIQIMYDHKNALNIRVNFLRDLGYIDISNDELSRFKSFENEAILARNLSLKCVLLHNKGYDISEVVENAVNRYTDLEKTEVELYELLISKLS